MATGCVAEGEQTCAIPGFPISETASSSADHARHPPARSASSCAASNAGSTTPWIRIPSRRRACACHRPIKPAPTSSAAPETEGDVVNGPHGGKGGRVGRAGPGESGDAGRVGQAAYRSAWRPHRAGGARACYSDESIPFLPPVLLVTRTDAARPPDPEGPDLSVVVPAVNGGGILFRVLEALASQVGGVRLEVLVPERTGESARMAVRARYPEARVLPVPEATPIPAMRRLAFAKATAPVVAVLEDHVLVPPDWASKVLASVSEARPVVAGWVFNSATEHLVDRAAFICEYNHMLLPPKSGRAEGITGNNTAYRRDLLHRFSAVIEEDRWEDHLHAAFRAAGVPLHVAAELSAAHEMRYRSAIEYAAQRYLYSRGFAGMRMRGRRLLFRWAYGIAAFGLPPVLLARVFRSAWRSSAHRADFLRSIGHQVLFVSAWSLGEVVGAFAGPGNTLCRVR